MLLEIATHLREKIQKNKNIASFPYLVIKTLKCKTKVHKALHFYNKKWLKLFSD